MKEHLLEEMARIISEMQAINIWIDDARTNRIARIRYQKLKPILQDLVEAHKKLTEEYKPLTKEDKGCTSQR